MTVRMKITRGKTGSRRSHHALTLPSRTACSHCGEPTLRHQVCASCGWYRGREVIKMEAKSKQQKGGKQTGKQKDKVQAKEGARK